MRYIVSNTQGVIKLTNLINGYLRTPKINTFYKLIDTLNIKYSKNISKLPVDISPLDLNAWLAGFTEADGYFGVSISEFKPKSETRKRSQSRRVKCRFIIEQRQIDRPTGLSSKSFMEAIAKYFDVSLLEINRKNKQSLTSISSNYLSVESTKKLAKVIKYFSIYPLLGIKNLDYQDFTKVYNMIVKGEHLTESGRDKIKEIVAGMNSYR